MHYYDDSLKVKDALQIYFSMYHFKDGGYNEKWFKIKAGPFYLTFPNIKSRVDAVKLHDIHHLITGYEANMQGECEISGWEIASGCGPYYMAWLLNLGSFFYGIFVYPRLLLKAFLMGKKCQKNLYDYEEYNEKLLNKTIREIRYDIYGNHTRINNLMDYLSFFKYCIIVLLPVIFIIIAFLN